MRSMAIGREWMRRGGSSRLIASVSAEIRLTQGSRTYPQHLVRSHAGILRTLSGMCRMWRPQVVLLDLAELSEEFVVEVRRTAPQAVLAGLDCNGPLSARVEVAINLFAHPLAATKCRARHCYFGLPFAILREEFDRHRSIGGRMRREVRRLLVSLGGTDDTEMTVTLVNELRKCLPQAVGLDIVVGPGVQNPENIHRQISDPSIRLYMRPARLAEMMSKCDVAVANAGTTALELMSLGKAVVVVGRNASEERFGEWLHELGGASYATARDGDVEAVCQTVRELCENLARRRRLGRRAWQLVDGSGRQRVVDILRRASLGFDGGNAG